MVVRISEDEKEISLGVGDLLSSNSFHQLIGFKFGKRLSIGQKLHQEYGNKLKSSGDKITTEKHVKQEFIYQKVRSNRQWSVKISGRIDVFIEKKGKFHIEEIKTLTPEEFKKTSKLVRNHDLFCIALPKHNKSRKVNFRIGNDCFLNKPIFLIFGVRQL